MSDYFYRLCRHGRKAYIFHMPPQLTLTDGTAQQQAFARHLVRDACGQTEAAKRAGYSPISAPTEASRLVRLPHVQELIRLEQQLWLRGDLTALSLLRINEILSSKPTNVAEKKIVLEAAKTVLDRSGHVAPKAADAPGAPKTVSDMTADELNEFVMRGLREKAERAITVIDIEPVSVPVGAQPPVQPVDIYD
jgi:hypothetical protein